MRSLTMLKYTQYEKTYEFILFEIRGGLVISLQLMPGPGDVIRP